MSHNVLILVPAFNEAASLPTTVMDLRTHCPSAEILVINDASTDNTAQVAKSLSVQVLTLPVNLGIGGAVQTGFQYALAHGYDLALQFDGDGQHQGRYLPTLIEEVQKGWDLVIGSRYLEGRSTFQTTFARRVGMVLFSLAYRIFTGQKITDTTSGLRACSKGLIAYFARNYAVDFPDMPAVLSAHLQGFRIREVPVTMNQRRHGVSSTNLLRSIWYPFQTLAAACAVYLRGKEGKR